MITNYTEFVTYKDLVLSEVSELLFTTVVLYHVYEAKKIRSSNKALEMVSSTEELHENVRASMVNLT